MRYIGNKSKLLSFIGDFLRARGIRGGRALDAFSGTATVGSYLKRQGFSVVSCDIMTYSYVFQRAYIVANGMPQFAGIRRDRRYRASQSLRPLSTQPQLEDLFARLSASIEPRESFITRNFSAGETCTDGERMYFTRETAIHIDGVREQLEHWQQRKALTDDEYYILLAALIEATDAAANTAGTYAAFLKTWQSNTRRPFQLSVPDRAVWAGLPCEAHQGEINGLIPSLGHFDLLYLDPPYNSRQYSGYYHIPELLARGWFNGDLILRGKTGLIGNSGQHSAWSSRAHCVSALEQLIASVDADHVVMSYNNEGLIPEQEIERVFRTHGIPRTYRRVQRRHARYRADSDGPRRRYTADRVTERLYYVRLRPRARPRPVT
jgi:adenine-specific DNA-methyltransferase